MSLAEAISRAKRWWQAAEVVRVFPDDQAATGFPGWRSHCQPGRQRVPDTLPATTFRQAGVKRLIITPEQIKAIQEEIDDEEFQRAIHPPRR